MPQGVAGERAEETPLDPALRPPPTSRAEDAVLSPRGGARQSSWYRFAERIRGRSKEVVAVVLLFTVPFALFIPTQQPNFSMELISPRGSPVWQTFVELQEKFGAGISFPSALVISTQVDGDLVTHPDFFDRTQKALTHLKAVTDTCYGGDEEEEAEGGGSSRSGCIRADYSGIMFASQLTASIPDMPTLPPAVSHEVPSLVDTVEEVVRRTLGLHNDTAVLNCTGFPGSGCVPYGVFALPAGCRASRAAAVGAPSTSPSPEGDGLAQIVCESPSDLRYNCSVGLMAAAQQQPRLAKQLARLTTMCGNPRTCKTMGCCGFPAQAASAETTIRQECAAEQYLYRTQVSSDQRITYLNVVLNGDPFEAPSLDWLRAVRTVREETEKSVFFALMPLS